MTVKELFLSSSFLMCLVRLWVLLMGAGAGIKLRGSGGGRGDRLDTDALVLPLVRWSSGKSLGFAKPQKNVFRGTDKT